MANISCGIVGLPNVGKSTLFNALTGSAVLAANYPFATIEPNTGMVPVPDERLQKLSQLYGNAPIKPAIVTFVDIAGLVAGASEGEGLGNQFLSHIRSTQAIVQVVRAFDDPNVTHVDDAGGTVAAPAVGANSPAQALRDPAAPLGRDPAKDIAVINTELVLADLQTVGRRLPQFAKEVRANPKLQPVLDTYQAAQELLDAGEPLWNHSQELGESGRRQLADLQLLTMKPVIYVFNLDEAGLADAGRIQKLRSLVAPAQALFVCAQLESELQDLDAADAAELLESYGQTESGLVQLIHAAYETLGLQSYLTAGEKEVRAWTIPRGTTAPQAAGVIHGDFERGFIAAEVVAYPDLVAAGSLTAARAAGQVRTEGKSYVMQPDDVVEFRFNVSK